MLEKTKNNSRKTILITGATGYLGKYLIKNNLEQGHNIIALGNSLRPDFEYISHPKVKTYYTKSEKDWKVLFNENKIDIIIHTAVSYGRNNETILDVLDTNLIFACDLLSLAVEYKVDTFINTDTILPENINPYAITKSQFTQWLEFYANSIRCINLKFDHFYGPYDNEVKFIAYIIKELKNNVATINLTEGSQQRDFIYIDDVIHAYECVINAKDLLPLGFLYNYNIGTNIKTSIKEVVCALKEKMDNTATTLNFGAIPYRKNELLDYEINTSAIRLLGWKPQVMVNEGLDRILKVEGLV